MTQTLSSAPSRGHGATITATKASVVDSAKRGAKSKNVPADKAEMYAANPSGIVVGLTLSMSWQLAVVFLVPLIAGHILDDKLNTSPWLTVTGLGLAMIFMILVVRKTLAQLNEYTDSHEVKTDKKGDA